MRRERGKTSNGRTGASGNQNGHARPASTGWRRRVPPPSTRVDAPPIVTVFRTADGELRHAWCRGPLEFQGRRAQLELDFYCSRCMEHVALPEMVAGRVPVRVAPERPMAAGVWHDPEHAVESAAE